MTTIPTTIHVMQSITWPSVCNAVGLVSQIAENNHVSESFFSASFSSSCFLIELHGIRMHSTDWRWPQKRLIVMHGITLFCVRKITISIRWIASMVDKWRQSMVRSKSYRRAQQAPAIRSLTSTETRVEQNMDFIIYWSAANGNNNLNGLSFCT